MYKKYSLKIIAIGKFKRFSIFSVAITQIAFTSTIYKYWQTLELWDRGNTREIWQIHFFVQNEILYNPFFFIQNKTLCNQHLVSKMKMYREMCRGEVYQQKSKFYWSQNHLYSRQLHGIVVRGLIPKLKVGLIAKVKYSLNREFRYIDNFHKYIRYRGS